MASWLAIGLGCAGSALVVGCVVGVVVGVRNRQRRRAAARAAAAAAGAGGGIGFVDRAGRRGNNTNVTRDGYCVYFMAGHCRNGKKCPHKHAEGEDEGRRKLDTAPPGGPPSFAELVAAEESKGKSSALAAKKVAEQIANSLPKVGVTAPTGKRGGKKSVYACQYKE